MAWFPDLSPYTYSAFALPGTVNVGWLEPGHPFPTGPAPAALLARLSELDGTAFVNHTRGPHRCGFCAPGGFDGYGSAEIHVVGADGRVYAAPSLILHYVRDHGYLPPAEFVAAVVGGVPVDPVPGDPEEALGQLFIHLARRALDRDPGRAALLLRAVLSKFAGSSAADEARQLMGHIKRPAESRATPDRGGIG